MRTPSSAIVWFLVVVAYAALVFLVVPANVSMSYTYFTIVAVIENSDVIRRSLRRLAGISLARHKQCPQTIDVWRPYFENLAFDGYFQNS